MLWFITLRLDVGAKCIVGAWLIASAYFFPWQDERDKVKHLSSLRDRVYKLEGG
ncbi:unnamed protein product [marine sediment metagenome]|uniref:Uncharacterized protein n=1 Tax=marine sediment metagenome TaxID=412755 RepID=X0VC57_9ZZZZ